MQIRQVRITFGRLDQAANFYRDVLQLPVDAQPGRVTVRVESSRLILEPGDHFHGVHRLAFGIVPANFELARAWLGHRVEPIVVDGSDVIVGPEGWHSTSVYFLGPEDILLEFIAREADEGSASEADAPGRWPSARSASAFLMSPTLWPLSASNLGCQPFPRRARTSPPSVATTVWSSWSTRTASGSPPPSIRQHAGPWTSRSRVRDPLASP